MKTLHAAKRLPTSWTVVCGSLAALILWGQTTASAQVVQLPSVRNFSYSGGAWGPDAGTAALGGNSYSRRGLGSQGFGPLAGRGGVASSGVASGMSISVDIIDLKAMDDAILNANVARAPGAPSPLSAGSPAADGGRSVLSGLSSGPYAGSLQVNPDPGQWQRALAGSGDSTTRLHASLTEANIRYYLERGKRAEQANHLRAARVYYRLAVESMSPQMIERYHKILAERAAAEEAQFAKNGRQQF